jgi:hypothetical protein
LSSADVPDFPPPPSSPSEDEEGIRDEEKLCDEKNSPEQMCSSFLEHCEIK